MSNTTCSTCKWWKSDQHDGPSGYRLCENPTQSTDVVNGEPFNSGELATGPDFGCNQHSDLQTDTSSTSLPT